MPDEDEEASVEVRRFASSKEAGEYALVLVAAGIDCELVPSEGGIGLFVAEARAIEARHELAGYAEDVRTDPSPRPPPLPLRSGLMGVLAYWCGLLFLYSAANQNAFSTDWFAVGEAQTGRIIGGEWWRIFTTLGLHANFGHLFSNLVAGSLFGFFLSEILGTGLAWLMILIAGGGGNVINAFIQPASHTSVGASTAIFGAIGLLAVLALRYRPSQWKRGLRRWLPVAGGIMLLAFLGMEGERIDIGAHVAGFLMGCMLGLGCLALGPSVIRHRMTEAFGIGAVTLFTGAWLLALLQSSP